MKELIKKRKEGFDHLINNIERISYENSIFNYKYGRKAFLSLGQGNIHEWLEKLLPNTRLILEPKIIGTSIALQYIDGKLNKVINEISRDITEDVMALKIVPNSLPINKRIELRGVIYVNENTCAKKNKTDISEIVQCRNGKKRINFCAFQIFHCQINQFQALNELKNLNFEIPQTQFTTFISDIEIYRQCWKQGKLFNSYPTCGIVLKINSRKFQKYLGENNQSIHWAYALN